MSTTITSTQRALRRTRSKGPGRLMSRPGCTRLYTAAQFGWFAGRAKQYLLRALGTASPSLRRAHLEEARENGRVAREYYAVMMESGVEA